MNRRDFFRRSAGVAAIPVAAAVGTALPNVAVAAQSNQALLDALLAAQANAATLAAGASSSIHVAKGRRMAIYKEGTT